MLRSPARNLLLSGIASLAATAGCVTHDLTAIESRLSANEVVPPALQQTSEADSPRSTAAARIGSPLPEVDEQAVAEDRRQPRSTNSESFRQKPAVGTARMDDAIRHASAEATTDRTVAEAETTGDQAPPSLPRPPSPEESGVPSARPDEESGPHAATSSVRLREHPHVAPIDFASALSMTAGKNPQVAFARERVDESLAQLLAAETLWLPSIRVGANYNKHEGRIQDVAGRVFETSRIASYGGLGARGVGAGSPTIPGVYMRFDTADAVFAPAAADSRSRALNCSAKATLNDELLESAVAYLDLLDAMQMQAIADETVTHSKELAHLTSEFARAGQGTEADANRAATNLAIQRNRLIGADAAVVVASARLSQQLRLDPSVLLTPAEPNVAPVCLVEPDQPVKELVAIGLSKRPELAANRHLAREAVQKLRREQYSVWLPSVLVGMDYGGMGGGFNNEIVNSGERFDFDAIAWWEVRNLGFGEKAARDQASSRVDQARLKTLETMDNIAREIVQFHAQAEAARAQVSIAQSAVESANDAYRRDIQRIRGGQGLPIEALQSLLALDAAQREYLRATIEHNKAQFQLQRALGWPVR